MKKALLTKKDTETDHKKPYEPPKVTFTLLKIEEKLMACGKYPPGHAGTCGKHSMS